MLLAPNRMHIPDGFLSIAVSAVLWVVSVLVVAYALKRVSNDLGERQVPLMGVLAAAIFAGQMLNFSVAGGTSGHLMGAALATILLGPWAAVLVMVCVVTIQALIFQDGGLVVMGANIFNMGITGVAVSYMVYHSLKRLFGSSRLSLLVGAFLAAWVSIEVTALSVALQLAISGTSPANLAIPAMALVHALIGIGEGLITVGALAFLYATRRDLIETGAKAAPAGPLVWVAGLLLALALAVASPLASANPDGLEAIAKQQGFISSAQSSGFTLVPNYIIPGVSNQALATILAAVLGTLVVFGVALGVAYARKRRAH